MQGPGCPNPKVLVVVPAYNAEGHIQVCLKSILRQRYPADRMGITVVDNNSTDGTRQEASQFSRVNVLVERDVQNPGAARNKALSRIQCDIIAFIDADCTAHRDWLQHLVGCLSNPNCDIVGGTVVVQTSSSTNLIEEYDHMTAFRQREYIEKAGVSGTGNMAVRKRVFDEVGLFKPDLLSAEDAEWGQRARKAGFSARYCAEAIVYHPARSSFRSLLSKQIRVGYGSGQRLTKPQEGSLKRIFLTAQEPARTASWGLRTLRLLYTGWRSSRVQVGALAKLLGLAAVFALANAYGRISACWAIPPEDLWFRE